jgi:hypothetical protein
VVLAGDGAVGDDLAAETFGSGAVWAAPPGSFETRGVLRVTGTELVVARSGEGPVDTGAGLCVDASFESEVGAASFVAVLCARPPDVAGPS